MKDKKQMQAALSEVFGEKGADAILGMIEYCIGHQQEEARKAARDNRVRNVRLLLAHYHLLQECRTDAVYDAETIQRAKEVTPEELFDLMRQTVPKYDVRLEGIEKAASRTHLLMCHLDMQLAAYREYCERSPRESQRRRWRVLSARFLEVPEKTCRQIAEDEHLVKRVIERDLQAAINDLAVKLFGIDALDEISEA